MSDTKTLTHLLDVLEEAAQAPHVSVRDVLHEFGDRSITPFILLIAVLLVSPLSGIPGLPTFSSIIVVSLTAQALAGRRHIWLPAFVMRREIGGDRLRKAVGWLRRPCAFLDRHSHQRIVPMTSGPMRRISLLICLIIPLFWPFLELLPLVTSIGAATIALVAFGLITRDGLYVLAGYIFTFGFVCLFIWLLP